MKTGHGTTADLGGLLLRAVARFPEQRVRYALADQPPGFRLKAHPSAPSR